MPNIRVHELAKELNMTSKELLNCIERLGIENKKPVSSLSDEESQKVKGFLNKSAKGGSDKPKQPVQDTQNRQPREEGQQTQNRQQGQSTGYQGQNRQPREGGTGYQGQNRQPREGGTGYQGQNRQPREGGTGYQGQNRQPREGGTGYQGQNRQSREGGTGYQGQNRQPREGGTGYQGQNRQGGYQGQNRQQGQGTGYQGQNRQQGQGTGYQGQNRQGGTGYQGQNRQQGQGTGYQGQNRQGGTGYQGQNRQQGQGTGYQGQNRQGGTGYQGQNRQGGTGYQGQNRQQGQGTGYQGQNRQQGQGGGYQGQNRQDSGQRQNSFTRQKQQFDQKPAGKLLEQQTKPVNTRYEQNKQIKSTKSKGFEKPDPRLKKQGPTTKKMTKKDRKNQKMIAKQQLEQQAIEEAKLKENDIKVVQIGKNISVKDFAEKLGKTTSEIIMPLMKLGIMATINQEIDFYTATNIAETFDIIVEEADEIDILEEAFSNEEEDREEDMQERPPVVVVMGHVDHGKTSLLDAIRHSRVTASEAGGITQHIGAYTVEVNDKPITFLDTPGHEAFTAMRMRGAQVTDIAILVVAADDGVMPQTIEAINHAKAANVEIIIAINKMDKPSANPDRVKQELVEHGIQTEDWGGEIICVPVSAIKGDGIDQLLEMILLTAEMRELKANPNRRAKGTIIEAELDKGRGPVATVLVQNGTLNVGDPIVAGKAYGKIRAMMDDKGNKVKKAGPSIPVEILGLSEVPNAGDMFYIAESERHARQVAESVLAQTREDLIKSTPQKVSLDDLFSQIKSGNVKDLNIVIKADVQGSVEAVKNSLERLTNDEVRIRVIHGGVGAVTESDVMLASASNAIIIGFNVRPENSAKSVADEEKVDLRLYRVIYNAIEDVTAAMKGMLDPIFEEKIIGHAEIRQTFKASGVGTIGGSYITDGKFQRNASVRIVRDGIVVYDGEIAALKRFKDDVKEVAAGYECGMTFNNYNDIKEGDKVEAYIMEEIKR